ncbi:GNAT family N-acetyltransferase [Chryseobacterium oranimense]|uniref:Protein N-acetyltransferase, RimJ/RimL family n=1 Tax=Chryseobacterium oranimense TaxID=421058 RepID=A0A1M5LLP3_9FLAO|nr:GNAT family N-acetyltransferase [Chryseobacterium oranimense]SHG65978.1 Protein N-acetyltransferase, RimJ/RimL family [Chryseobacterium oranimense]
MKIETQRLILRKFEEKDAERMFLLDSNPEVMKYIGVPVLTDPAESLKIIRMIQKQYEENGTGRLAVIEKETGLLIGWSGLKLLTEEINGYKNVLDLGYRYLPESWGKGYALEAAKASLELGFHQMKAEVIYAHAHSENQGSNHILKKLGFEKTGEFTEPDGICNWYELTHEKYLQ